MYVAPYSVFATDPKSHWIRMFAVNSNFSKIQKKTSTKPPGTTSVHTGAET